MSNTKAIGPDELPVEIHPAANLFPMMDEQSYAELKADIDQNGIQVWMTFLDGKLIDGRNRYRACVELGIDPDHYSDELDADLVPDPVDWVLSVNLHRRHLTTSQRAMIAAQVATLRRGDNQHSKEDGQKCPPSTSEAAKQLHVGDRTVKQAKSVLREGCKSLADAVSAGTVPVSLADKLTRKVSDHDEQERLVSEGVEAIRKAVADPPPDTKVQTFDMVGVARSKIADCSELFGDDRAETLRGILLDEAALIEERLTEGGQEPQDFDDDDYEDVPDDDDADAEVEDRTSRGVGVERAHEAIACLKRIPKTDGLRGRAMEIVVDWIQHNAPTDPDESPLTALRPVIFNLEQPQLIVLQDWLRELLGSEE